MIISLAWPHCKFHLHEELALKFDIHEDLLINVCDVYFILLTRPSLLLLVTFFLSLYHKVYTQYAQIQIGEVTEVLLSINLLL